MLKNLLALLLAKFYSKQEQAEVESSLTRPPLLPQFNNH